MFAGQVDFDTAGNTSTLACCINRRLHLRPLELSDTADLFALTEANRTYLRQWLPWLDANREADDTRNFIRMSVEKAQTQDEFVSAIVYDHAVVGLVGLHEINWHNRSAGIGYWLAESHQGKGLITQASGSIIDYGFATLALNRIDIRCAAKNSRSEAVAKRLGLTYEGRLREAEWLYDHFVDHNVYSMLWRDWASLKR